MAETKSLKTEAGLDELNKLLSTQSYVAGGAQATQEDFERYAQITCNISLDAFPHARRWYQHIRSLKAKLPLKKWPRASGAAPAGGRGGKDNSSGGKGVDQANLEGLLKDAVEGKVCTRFPPEPSGYLHIGHAKAAMLNNHYARKYKGKLILRFDDTNPSKEKQEFQDAIIKDLATLQVYPDKVTHTSDYFDQLQKITEEMIQKGVCYVDDTPVDKMREERDKGVASARRSQPVEENLRMWKEMLKGSPEGLGCCVRGKMDMTNKNKCLRDPVFYRCKVDTPHHRTGTKYKAYPTYDLACPVVDSIEGVSHALRTIEYKDRDPMYEWVQDNAPGCKKNEVVEFAKTQFSHTILSKRKLTWFVEKGYVTGWDDPRFPTVQGIIRRGMTVEGLSEFVKTQGMSKATNLMEWDKIWALNKQVIDPIVPRYAAVFKEGAVLVKLSNGPKEPVGKMDAKHPKNPDLGQRLILQTSEVYLDSEDAEAIEKGEEITLLHWGNAIIENIVKKDGAVVELHGKCNPEGNPKTTKKKVHWVPNLPDQVTPCVLRELDHLVTKPKIEDDDSIENIINPVSLVDTDAIGDPLLKTLAKGDKIQLERRGYFIVDQAAFTPGVAPGSPIVLIKIPDGKAKDMGLKSKVDPKTLQGQQSGKSEEKKDEKASKKDEAATNGKAKDAGKEEKGKDAKGKDAKGKAKAAAKPADRPLDDISRLNIKVGKIVKVWPHPEADKLYCEEIDLGEPEGPRTIASGLRPFLKEEEMLNKMVVVLANLKPRTMVGFKSQGMVLCANNADKSKVELLEPPAGSKIGERVVAEGVDMLEPDDKLNEKEGKAPWPALAPGCKTTSGLQAAYNGAVWKTSAGPVVCKSIADGAIS